LADWVRQDLNCQRVQREQKTSGFHTDRHFAKPLVMYSLAGFFRHSQQKGASLSAQPKMLLNYTQCILNRTFFRSYMAKQIVFTDFF